LLTPEVKPRAIRSNITRTETFISPITCRLYDYWRSKCDEKSIPGWRDIDLMDLYDIAPNVVVRDAVDGGSEFRCRYFGSNLVEAFGLDPTGKLLQEAYPGPYVDVVRERYLTAMTSNGPTRVIGYIDLVSTTVPRVFEFIMLPLTGDSNKPGHVLGATDFSYELREEDFDDGYDPASWGAIRLPSR
jgi:hypothetical protein